MTVQVWLVVPSMLSKLTGYPTAHAGGLDCDRVAGGAHRVRAHVWLVVSCAAKMMPDISARSFSRDRGLPVSGSSMRFRQAHRLLSPSP